MSELLWMAPWRVGLGEVGATGWERWPLDGAERRLQSRLRPAEGRLSTPRASEAPRCGARAALGAPAPAVRPAKLV